MRTVFSTFIISALLSAPMLRAADSERIGLEPLYQLRGIEGRVQVRFRNETEFKSAREGRAYPYGTEIRTAANSSVIIVVSARQDFFRVGSNTLVTPDAETPDAEAPNASVRVLRLASGEVRYSISQRLGTANLLKIVTPLAIAEQLRGDGLLTLSGDPTLRELRIEPRTESIRLYGWQFNVPALRSETTLRITATPDRSYTELANLGGDYAIDIETDDDDPVTINTSPLSTIKIWRQFAPVGGRLLVSVLVSDPRGRQTDQFVFPTDIVKNAVTR